jgi:hypothetical protein
MKLTFGEAVYEPDAVEPLSVTGQVENHASRTVYAVAPVVATVEGQTLEGYAEGGSTVPSGAKANVTFRFRPTGPLTALTGLVLTVGDSGKARATISLAAGGRVETLEPRRVLGAARTIRAGNLTVKVSACDLRADNPEMSIQAGAEQRYLTCKVDVTYRGGNGSGAGQNIDGKNFRLRLPTGATRTADAGPIEVLDVNQHKTGPVWFTLDWPAPGRYAVQVLDLGMFNAEAPSAKRTGEATFTIS